MSPENRGRQGGPPHAQGYRAQYPGGGTAPRPSGASGHDTAAMPRANTVTYFADRERKALNPSLVDSSADALAQKIAQVPASQMRRFYGDVLALERRLATGGELPAEAIRAHMALLKAKAAYASKRAGSRPEQFPRELLEFFVDHAAAVTDRTDFDAFRRAFEAVIAYHKFYERKGHRD